jgi:transposase-like protein
MMRGNLYSLELKESISKRFQGASPPKIAELSVSTGISKSTLYLWRQQALPSISSPSPLSCSPPRRSADEKWRLIKLSEALEGQELGEFLRREGLHLAQLDEWRTDILKALKPMNKKIKSRSKRERELEKRVKYLEADLKRKESALAEAAALLLLSKKVKVLWEEEDAATAPNYAKGSSK